MMPFAARAEDIVEGHYDCSDGTRLLTVYIPFEASGEDYFAMYYDGRLFMLYAQHEVQDGAKLFRQSFGTPGYVFHAWGAEGSSLGWADPDAGTEEILHSGCKFGM